MKRCLNVGAPVHDVTPRTRQVGLPYPGLARIPRHRSNHRSEARAATTVHLGSVTRAWKLRPVPRGRCALAGGRTAIPHWSSAPPHVTTASAPIP
jgi:hypothetical protein